MNMLELIPLYCLMLQYVPPDLCICTFVLEQSLSVRALQEMLAKSGQNSEGVSAEMHTLIYTPLYFSLPLIISTVGNIFPYSCLQA